MHLVEDMADVSSLRVGEQFHMRYNWRVNRGDPRDLEEGVGVAKASARWRTWVLALILPILVAAIVHQPITRLYFEHMEVRMFAVAEAEGWDAEAIINYAENHPLRWLTAKAGGRRFSLEVVLVMSAYLDAILDDEPKKECAEALMQWLSRKGADVLWSRDRRGRPANVQSYCEVSSSK